MSIFNGYLTRRIKSTVKRENESIDCCVCALEWVAMIFAVSIFTWLINTNKNTRKKCPKKRLTYWSALFWIFFVFFVYCTWYGFHLKQLSANFHFYFPYNMYASIGLWRGYLHFFLRYFHLSFLQFYLFFFACAQSLNEFDRRTNFLRVKCAPFTAYTWSGEKMEFD